MKTGEILALNIALQQAAADLEQQPVKFAYAIARNLRRIEPIVVAYQEAMRGEWMAPIEAFDRERTELVKQHARRDEVGNMMFVGPGQALLTDPDQFNVAIEELKVRHPDMTSAQVQFDERQAELLGIEENVTLHKIVPDDLPAMISVNLLHALLPMIADDE